MRLLALGDMHYRDTKPLRRKDNFNVSYSKKMKFLERLCIDEQIDITMVPGDIFDSVNSTFSLVNRAMNEFNRMTNVFPHVGVYGNHDLPNHTFNWSDTPLSMLQGMNVFRKISPEPTFHNGVWFYGVSWDEEIPELNGKEGVHVLVIHKMIIDEKIWEGQENAAYSKAFLRKNPFDLIVSGDNHKFFTETIKDRHLVNCGSLMRQKINQYDHKPSVVIYDSVTKEIKIVEIPVKPSNVIFDLDGFEKIKENKELNKEWIKDLQDMKISEGTDYVKNAQVKANSDNVSNRTREEVNDIIKSQH